MSRTLLVLVLVLVAPAGLLLSLARPAAADPMTCVVAYDANGNPMTTVCVPSP